MNVNEKLALKNTFVDLGKFLGISTLGASIFIGGIIAAQKIGFSDNEIVNGLSIVLILGVIGYCIHSVYKMKLSDIEFKQRMEEIEKKRSIK